LIALTEIDSVRPAEHLVGYEYIGRHAAPIGALHPSGAFRHTGSERFPIAAPEETIK
jgi:hypothetical protein